MSPMGYISGLPPSYDFLHLNSVTESSTSRCQKGEGRRSCKGEIAFFFITWEILGNQCVCSWVCLRDGNFSLCDPGPCGCNGLTGAKNRETFPIQVAFKRSPFCL